MCRPTLPNALYITVADTPGAANSGTPAALRAGAYRHATATDAQVAIQSAIDYFRGKLIGGTVYLAPGLFNTSAPIRLYEGISLVGSGMAATQVKVLAGSYCDAIQHLGEYTDTGAASAGAAATLTDSSKSWTTDAYANKYVYIYGGTGAGQRRLIISNTATALTISTGTTNWGTNPDNTSKYSINATQQLFMRISDMTIYGNKATNAAATGTATGGSTTTITVAGGWTAGRWDDKATVEITGGTNAGEIRRVISNTATTLTVDGPFTLACDGTTVFSIGGSGIAMYGHSAYDLMLTDVWTDDFAHHGVYSEDCWGHVYKNLISEYNGLDGLRTSLSPYMRGTTGTWPATAGVSPTEGPKMSLCKLVRNLRHGIFLGEYTYESEIVGCEVAGGGTGGYGITMATSAPGNTITGCRVVSSAGTSTGAFNLASIGNTCTANVIRSGAGAAGLTYGIRVASSGNTIVGNTIDLAAGTPISDDGGQNTYEANRTNTTVQRFRVRGKKALPKGVGDYITINPQLGTAPAACVITPLLTPADAFTEAAGKWSVAAYPVPTASAIQIKCDTALSSVATATVGNISAGSMSIEVADSSAFAIGQHVIVAQGSGGSITQPEEAVAITAKADATHFTATFAYPHTGSVAVTTAYTFFYDIGYNDRSRTAA